MLRSRDVAKWPAPPGTVENRPARRAIRRSAPARRAERQRRDFGNLPGIGRAALAIASKPVAAEPPAKRSRLGWAGPASGGALPTMGSADGRRNPPFVKLLRKTGQRYLPDPRARVLVRRA